MPGGLQAEYQGGLNGAVGTMAAWLHHNIHGTGQHVDVSVMECISANLESMLFMYTFMGAVRRRWYSRNITSLPSEIYRCKDVRHPMRHDGGSAHQAENDEPHPQVVCAFGLRITNCAPSRSSR